MDSRVKEFNVVILNLILSVCPKDCMVIRWKIIIKMNRFVLFCFIYGMICMDNLCIMFSHTHNNASTPELLYQPSEYTYD